MKKVSIIGSGFSSLSAACYLARDGYDVTVYEKNAMPGGRASIWKEGGYTFDMGPTWYWMPDVFEKFFVDFDLKPESFYELTRLDPAYRVYFGENQKFDVPADLDALYATFESTEKGSAEKLKSFLSTAEKTYRTAVQGMVYKPGKSPLELITPETIKHAGLFVQSIRQLVRKNFKHPHLVSLLEFPVLFLGAKPGNIPAFYNFMNYADMVLGTWYPRGGMYSVVQAMTKMAELLGVKIKTNSNVESLLTNTGAITGLKINGTIQPCDIVVSGADYSHTESLLPTHLRGYTPAYWNNRVLAPSALLFYLGVNKKLKGIMHHTLFFDAPFDPHAESIYDSAQWPDEPLFYASFPSQTDADCAPEGCENVTLLIPIAPGIEDNKTIRDIYYHKIMDRLEKLTGQNVRDHVTVKRSYCINDFVHDYNSYKGNAYGLANTLWQTAFLRPSIVSKKVKNLYFTGQLTVPGPGVPPAIISGKIAAAEVLKQNPVYHESV